MPDFFVPGVDYGSFQAGGGQPDSAREKSRNAIKSADLETVLKDIRKALNAEVVKKVDAFYQFKLKGFFEIQ